jgi:DNA-binding IclR family transcriptional regulator
VAVLELLAAHPDERFTLSEVARRCMLNKATAHALLNALSERGVLLRHPTEKRYSLGPRLILVGEAARRGYTATDFAPPIVAGLAATTGLWARAWQVRGDQLVCVAQAGAPAGSVHAAAVGVPLAPPLGAAVIASSDEPTREAWLARAAVGDAVSPALDALAAVRDWGYAATLASDEWWAFAGVWRAAAGDGHDGDGQDGADGRSLLAAIGRQHLLVTRLDDGESYRLAEVSAPVFDVSGLAVLMVSVTCVPGMVVPASDVRALGRRVMAAADGLTAATCGQRSAGGGRSGRVVQAVDPAAGNEAV